MRYPGGCPLQLHGTLLPVLIAEFLRQPRTRDITREDVGLESQSLPLKGLASGSEWDFGGRAHVFTAHRISG